MSKLIMQKTQTVDNGWKSGGVLKIFFTSAVTPIKRCSSPLSPTTYLSSANQLENYVLFLRPLLLHSPLENLFQR